VAGAVVGTAVPDCAESALGLAVVAVADVGAAVDIGGAVVMN
jgi:hypothetical protein